MYVAGWKVLWGVNEETQENNLNGEYKSNVQVTVCGLLMCTKLVW